MFFFVDSSKLSKHLTKMPQKRKQLENELIASLIEKFGLTNAVTDPRVRNGLWKEITQEFNQVTGNDYEYQKLSKQWKNYTQAMKKDKFSNDDFSDTDDTVTQI